MYDEAKAQHAVDFIQNLKHTKGIWYGVPFELLPWQDKIIRDVFGTVKENGYRQYSTAGLMKLTGTRQTSSWM